MPRSRASLCRCAAAALAVFTAAAPNAGSQPERPQSANRLVGVFDFEERARILEPVPMHWVRVVHNPPEHVNPGFPPWNESGFDSELAVSGDWSVKLPTRGGSAGLRLSGGVLAAIPGADYVVSSKVRTTNLRHARARMRAWLLDESLTAIEGSERATPFVRSPGAWSDLQIELSGDFPTAAWIQIAIELLQPAQQRTRLPQRHDLDEEDFDAAAWFDDVAVHQLPRVILSTNSPVNVIVAPEAPRISAHVRDLTGERLSGRMELRDIDGRLVDARDFEGSGRSTGFSWTPDLERFGWHRATLTILGDGRTVAHSDIDFIWTPRTGPALQGETMRFGVVDEGVGAEQFAAIPLLAEAMGVGFLHLPLWLPGQSEDDFDRHLAAMEPVVNRMLDRGRRVTFTLPSVPGALASELRIDPTAPIELVNHAPERWSNYLDPALARFGQRVSRWQAGPTGDDGHPERPDLSAKSAQLRHLLEKLSPEPVVTLPWPGDQTIDAERVRGASLTLSLPWQPPAHALEATLEIWRAGGIDDATLVFERAPDDRSTARSRVIELTKRAVYACAPGAPRLAIERPWSWAGAAPRVAPELAAWRTIIEQLAGRSIMGRLPAAPGVRAIILSAAPGDSASSFDAQAGGADAPPAGLVAAWSEWSDPRDAFIEGYFGAETLTVVDVFGNERTIDARPDGSHRIQLGRTPLFIRGVDERVAMFRGLFRIEPGFLISLAARHEMEVVVSNPWNTAISGRIRIPEPASWDISPRVQSFTIPPHGEVRLPISATIGVGEEAGQRTVRGEVELNADREHPHFVVDTPVEIGLDNLTVTATARRIPSPAGGPDDLAVSMLLTNTGRRTVTMNTFAVTQGYPRQQAPVSGLEPGASTMRQFIFRNAADKLSGQSIRVGVLDVSGPIRLNHTITAP